MYKIFSLIALCAVLCTQNIYSQILERTDSKRLGIAGNIFVFDVKRYNILEGTTSSAVSLSYSRAGKIESAEFDKSEIPDLIKGIQGIIDFVNSKPETTSTIRFSFKDIEFRTQIAARNTWEVFVFFGNSTTFATQQSIGSLSEMIELLKKSS
ncbi:MAG: hypothetical protein FWC41_02885 [Firmicutes bacterium]|nr:hypothetical protein [Bacillota bacterium]